MNFYRFVHLSSIILAICSALMIAGCSGAGATKNNSPKLTDTQIQLVMDAADEKFLSLPKDEVNRKASAQKLVSFLQSKVEIKGAVMNSDGTFVGAEFKDGHKFAFRIGGTGIAPIYNQQVISSKAHIRPSGKEIPMSSDARVIDVFGSSTDSVTSVLKSNGYSITNSNTTLTSLKNQSPTGDGVFYFLTHGVVHDDGLSLFNFPYTLWTSTPYTKEGRRLYREDYDADRIIPITEVAYLKRGENNGKDVEIYKKHWAITEHFVRKYMRFDKDSFVYINACLSNSSASTNMRQAFFDAGASVYAGWTKNASGAVYAIGPKVIEDLMGNKTTTGAINYARLNGKYIDNDPSNPQFAIGAELVFTPNPKLGDGDFGQLAPSIDKATYNKETKEIMINGTFGSDPGSEGVVTLGTTALTRVGNWASTRLVYSAAGISPGAYDLSVTVRGHRSNNYSVNLPIRVSGMYTLKFHDDYPDPARYWLLGIEVDNSGKITKGALYDGSFVTPISTSVSGKIDSSYNFTAQTKYYHPNLEISYLVKFNGKVSLNNYGENRIAGEFETIGNYPEYMPPAKGYFHTEYFAP